MAHHDICVQRGLAATAKLIHETFVPATVCSESSPVMRGGLRHRMRCQRPRSHMVRHGMHSMFGLDWGATFSQDHSAICCGACAGP